MDENEIIFIGVYLIIKSKSAFCSSVNQKESTIHF